LDTGTPDDALVPITNESGAYVGALVIGGIPSPLSGDDIGTAFRGDPFAGAIACSVAADGTITVAE